MELKDFFKKVGSDPCLVLDFDLAAEISGTLLKLSTLLKSTESVDESYAFGNDFANMIEEISKTHNVTFRFKIKTDDPLLAAINNSTVCVNNFVFGDTIRGRQIAAYLIITSLNNDEIIVPLSYAFSSTAIKLSGSIALS